MPGVSALTVGRGNIVPAPNSLDPVGHNLGRFEVVEYEAGDSRWAIRELPFEREFGPWFDDWWWRRLDCFAADYDDPRILDILQRILDQRRRDNEPPSEILPVVDATETESGIVEMILYKREWRDDFPLPEPGNDLLVDVIRMERSRW